MSPGLNSAAREPLRQAQRRLGELIFRLPAYHRLLARAPALQPVTRPEDPWIGQRETADEIFRGIYDLAGERETRANSPPWRTDRSLAWHASLHGFDWLRHFAAADGQAARNHARTLIQSWLDQADPSLAVAWRADVVGRRLINWVFQLRWLLVDASDDFRDCLLRALVAQARHLNRSVGLAPPGEPRLAAAVGLIASGIALPDGGARLDRGLRVLKRELADQFPPDGVHISRNPSQHHQALRDLLGARQCLLAGQMPVPMELQHAIDRAAPILRFFRHSDGVLALFNGGNAGDRDAVDLTLVRAHAPGRAPASAPHGGFERVEREATTLLVDVGPCRSTSYPYGHAGLLSFEVSAGGEQLFVNCGAAGPGDREWVRATAATAAHSTITLADHNAVALDGDGRLRRRPSVRADHQKDRAGQVWLQAEHDGYLSRFGITHRRRLFVSNTGEAIHGEDVLQRQSGRRAAPAFAARFHLHPAIKVSLVQGGSGALLQTASGVGWRFRIDGGTVTLDESIYLGDPKVQRRCSQIVVTGQCSERSTRLRWSLSRMSVS